MTVTQFRRENFVEVTINENMDSLTIHAPSRFMAYQLLDLAMTAMDDEAEGKKVTFRFTEE